MKAHSGQSSCDIEFLQQVYKFALSRNLSEESLVAEMVGLVNLSVLDIHNALAELTQMGLLRNQPQRGIVAVSPDEAVSRVLGPLEHEIRTRRVRIEETRERLMSFTPLFDANPSTGEERRQVERIDNLADVRVAIAELSAKCGKEILTAQPGGGRRESVLTEAAPRDYDALRKGVEMRILYQHTARSSRGTHTYVQQVTRLGAQVRTLNDGFMRFLIFDRECAIFAIPDDPDAAAFIRDPYAVAFMVEAYERLWLAADPFSANCDAQPAATDDLKAAIIRLLKAGMTDAAVARRLGMSLRTSRRHVAEIMATLDAGSRFEAGYLLGVQKRSE